nr:hypothetical protein [Tanacetum cinerariifolium]
MSTRSSARNLFPPLDNPELTIQRRSRTDPTLLNNSEMATKGNGDLPVPDLRTMGELCQPSLNGRGGPIAPIAIQATNFGLKNDMIQQVQNSCQFHGLPGGTFMKRHPEECYNLIENMNAHFSLTENNKLKLFKFVNKMKTIKYELEIELSIVLIRTVSNFIQEFMSVKKPDKVKVKNPTGVKPKGREKQKRIKSGREISMKKSV